MSNLTKEEIIKINSTLIGNISAIGSTHVDDDRFENLETQIHVVDKLLYDIMEESNKHDRVEYSVSRSGMRARKFLKQIYNGLSEYVEED